MRNVWIFPVKNIDDFNIVIDTDVIDNNYNKKIKKAHQLKGELMEFVNCVMKRLHLKIRMENRIWKNIILNGYPKVEAILLKIQ